MTSDVVFLLDVDNTLVDNDRIIVDLRRHLEREFGVASSERYWAIFETMRSELGYADYLGALQRYRSDAERGGADHLQRILSEAQAIFDRAIAPSARPLAPSAAGQGRG
jgi:hypothetical protein